MAQLEAVWCTSVHVYYNAYMIIFLYTGGSDFVQTQQTEVTFEMGEHRACFDVVIIDDLLSEGVEEFYATITTVQSGVDVGVLDKTIISIMDDESKMATPIYQ